MCTPVVAIGFMALGALQQARGAETQSQAQASLYAHQAAVEQAAGAQQAAVERNKAVVAEYQARDAVLRGQQAQTQQQLKTAQLHGAQRARFAAAGLDVTEGSAYHTLEDTKFMGKLDELTLADNAAKEAWAYRESAKTGMSSAAFIERQAGTNASFLRSRAAAESPSRAFGTSLLGSAGQVASAWYGMSRASTF